MDVSQTPMATRGRMGWRSIVVASALSLILTAGWDIADCFAQDPSASPGTGASARTLDFENDIMASRPNDPRTYVLLGSGFLRAFVLDTTKLVVARWLRHHPKAVETDISRMRMTNTISHEQSEIVYIWIDDGRDSLNVDLVRRGMVAGATMFDMVDNQKGLDEMLANDPSLADTKAEIEKERAAAPQDRTDRLIPDADYKARMMRIDEAEQYARANKLGIWADAMKEERESEGIQ